MIKLLMFCKIKKLAEVGKFLISELNNITF